ASFAAGSQKALLRVAQAEYVLDPRAQRAPVFFRPLVLLAHAADDFFVVHAGRGEADARPRNVQIQSTQTVFSVSTRGVACRGRNVRGLAAGDECDPSRSS